MQNIYMGQKIQIILGNQILQQQMGSIKKPKQTNKEIPGY